MAAVVNCFAILGIDAYVKESRERLEASMFKGSNKFKLIISNGD